MPLTSRDVLDVGAAAIPPRSLQKTASPVLATEAMKGAATQLIHLLQEHQSDLTSIKTAPVSNAHPPCKTMQLMPYNMEEHYAKTMGMFNALNKIACGLNPRKDCLNSGLKVNLTRLATWLEEHPQIEEWKKDHSATYPNADREKDGRPLYERLRSAIANAEEAGLFKKQERHRSR